MKRFWLFRSNLKSLEYYHKYTNLSDFVKKCHDYYLLLPLWMLQSGNADEVTIWRLTDRFREPIIFDVTGKKFIQRWVNNFNEVFDYPKPDISFFRGGFREYDEITKRNPLFFTKSIYLGAGQRINAQWGGKYDLILMEDDQDLKNNPGTKPFYKTASPYVFHPQKTNYEWDICWPCNFTQLKYKGQEEFIKLISKDIFLSNLKIVHCGNRSEVGRKLCRDNGVSNIEFIGPQERTTLNNILNKSKFGLNLSNRLDGCPRVSTEIMMAGTPLIIHERTRLLSYYKGRGVVKVNNENIIQNIKEAMNNFDLYKKDILNAIEDELSFDSNNQKNMDVWFN